MKGGVTQIIHSRLIVECFHTLEQVMALTITNMCYQLQPPIKP